jgi:hypothetical protein
MKKIIVIVLLCFVVAIGGTACDKFGGAKKAFQAYKKEAKVVTSGEYEVSRKYLMKFVGSTAAPHLMKLDYELESTESAGDGQLKLVVLETMHFEHENMDGKMSKSTKHHVLMEKDENGKWASVDVEIENLD